MIFNAILLGLGMISMLGCKARKSSSSGQLLQSLSGDYSESDKVVVKLNIRMQFPFLNQGKVYFMNVENKGETREIMSFDLKSKTESVVYTINESNTDFFSFSFKPDGKILAVVWNGFKKISVVYEIDVSAKTHKIIEIPSITSAIVAHLHNGDMVYQKKSGDETSLWIMNSTYGNHRLFVDGAWLSRGTSIWAPKTLTDGRIIFSAHESESNRTPPQLWIKDPVTNKLEQVTNTIESRSNTKIYGLAPLPNNKFAFLSDLRSEGEFDVWIYDLTSKTKTMVLRHPSMSIGSAYIAIDADENGKLFVNEIGRDFTPGQLVFISPKGTGNNGTFNPDGTSPGGDESAVGNSRSSVTQAQFVSAISRNISTYSVYNADLSMVNICKDSGKRSGWTQRMQEYYCTLPGNTGAQPINDFPPMRNCFTFSVRGINNFKLRSYAEAYDFCSTDPASGVPMQPIRNDPEQDRIFRAVMIDKTFN